MVLVADGAKAVDAGVAVEAEMAEVIGDGVLFREDQDRMCGESVIDAPDNGFHFWGENELNTMPQQGVNRGKPSGESVQEFTILSVPSGRERVCLESSAMGTTLVSEAALSALGLTTEEEIVCPESSASVSTRLACSGNSASFEVVLSKPIE